MPPISIATRAAAKPTISETRAPQIIRLEHVDAAVVEAEPVLGRGRGEHRADLLVLVVRGDHRGEDRDQHEQQQDDRADVAVGECVTTRHRSPPPAERVPSSSPASWASSGWTMGTLTS